MGNRVGLTGNDAGAEALMHVDPDVAAVFPITPQTELMHKFSAYVNDGVVGTELVTVESEHSAQSACFGSASAGARTITATSANGLMLMAEICCITSSARLPVVMPVVNRAISGPINIHCDHSDAMFCRDSGWIQLYCENAQEVYDTTVQAFRIAEHPDVLLPVMVCLDGFILSHTMEMLEVEDRDSVQKFVGEYKPAFSLLDTANPVTVGPLHLTDYYFECKRQQQGAMDSARQVVLDVGKEFGETFGREYGWFEEYKLDDAEVAIVALGSTAGTAKVAADQARERGVKAGVLKPRMFRPFPGDELAEVVNRIGAVAVMDRAMSYGLNGGPLFTEIRSFANGGCPVLLNYVYGLGGRDINATQIEGVFDELVAAKSSGDAGDLYRYIGLRE
jgi:pyruvate ferredoxin oxidoreductase alpha subunit